jgi:DNA-binding transcriptional LysR family regulator
MGGTRPDLNEFAIFGAVAERRSFTGGARSLRLPKATVSRKIQDLETRLGVQLLYRTTRKVTLTEAGEALLTRWRVIEEQLEDADVAIGRLLGSPRGLLRVAAGPTLMSEWVAPLAAEFLASHPDLRIELLAGSEPVEMVGHGADLAVAHAPQADSSNVARLLATAPTGIYASPGYLARHGTPATPEALAEHATLFLASSPLDPREWRLRRGQRELTVPLTPRLTSNSLQSLLAGLQAGVGLLVVPRALTSSRIAAGQMVQVLPEWSPAPLELRVVLPGRRGLPSRVRLFVDLLAERAAALAAPEGPPPVAPART